MRLPLGGIGGGAAQAQAPGPARRVALAGARAADGRSALRRVDAQAGADLEKVEAPNAAVVEGGCGRRVGDCRAPQGTGRRGRAPGGEVGHREER